ncbi:MAG: hypothetical protein A2725_00505 [Candidatus Magasanikbacteria bacterium RIFCSPHIGHO2_01_FULL_33_34]|uniref:AtpZ/AtpI family protein n=1 Tax=Candidatus Magasanikbacteria bacterium RIFCSPHIGHO2_01_FULL_33_34 TaxID=1798671 RepID=A0A1F6LLC3_9BACT|nr:MAG: hypothetical protein A2725_00505 [Candidatus Magasanikbacteria bacterium RIFCSPHIGHO2_01_FULL_33_34]OGH65840.1 MAG: hypothetical protein A3B83_03175 [Candidatus Magasanikbacteria bacterium RIFCSPHIGHO2_02_FULL_33_17]OGH75205.1 MAG: hypothetical protein A3A89_03770 [Candidatus Magasanikbacteria bacterium RIFCSPLOWO2_01_FULL_33_34]OGH82228.1 MAG: hypothetical protein A3F93_01570 [Candidatus Magasanikbacteria bacterium RIFCSPLOWO2_12_FULL_34_7]
MALLPKDQQDRKYILLGFKIVGDFGAIIAIPVVVFVLIAQWLEGKYGGSPYITITAFVFASVLTAYMIKKKAKEYGAEYEKLNNKKAETNQSLEQLREDNIE